VGATPGALSYVLNAGFHDPSLPTIPNDQTAANGLFLDNFTGTQSISMKFLSNSQGDGASNTLMVSENIQANSWLAPDASKHHYGFVWHGTSGPAPNPANAINVDSISPNLDIQHARPSSNHLGGVVAAFCDGRTHFLADTIDYNVYRQLMTSSSQLSSQSVKVLLDSSQY
jgi:hypothetical protein